MPGHCPLVATTICIAIALAACTPGAQRAADRSGDTAPAHARGSRPTQPEPRDVVAFWTAAGPTMWFVKDPAFDTRFRETFADLYGSAISGALGSWEATPEGMLALLILLDQYPRNSFRDTPRMYGSDELARAVAERGVASGRDRVVPVALRLFVYLPFAHSERLSDQDRSVELARTIGDDNLRHAEHHRDIILRFGRFPHRNPILGRPMRPEEQKYLDEGGYRG